MRQPLLQGLRVALRGAVRPAAHQFQAWPACGRIGHGIQQLQQKSGAPDRNQLQIVRGLQLAHGGFFPAWHIRYGGYFRIYGQQVGQRSARLCPQISAIWQTNGHACYGFGLPGCRADGKIRPPRDVKRLHRICQPRQQVILKIGQAVRGVGDELAACAAAPCFFIGNRPPGKQHIAGTGGDLCHIVVQVFVRAQGNLGAKCSQRAGSAITVQIRTAVVAGQHGFQPRRMDHVCVGAGVGGLHHRGPCAGAVMDAVAWAADGHGCFHVDPYAGTGFMPFRKTRCASGLRLLRAISHRQINSSPCR